MRILPFPCGTPGLISPVKEQDLYVPLRSHRGLPFSPARLARLKKRLIQRFGGPTDFPQRNEGFWKPGAFTFRDEIVILRGLYEEDGRVRKFWIALKEALNRRWRQQGIMIVARDIAIV